MTYFRSWLSTTPAPNDNHQPARSAPRVLDKPARLKSALAPFSALIASVTSSSSSRASIERTKTIDTITSVFLALAHGARIV